MKLLLTLNLRIFFTNVTRFVCNDHAQNKCFLFLFITLLLQVKAPPIAHLSFCHSRFLMKCTFLRYSFVNSFFFVYKTWLPYSKSVSNIRDYNCYCYCHFETSKILNSWFILKRRNKMIRWFYNKWTVYDVWYVVGMKKISIII